MHEKRLITSIILVIGAFIGAAFGIVLEAYVKNPNLIDLYVIVALFGFLVAYVYFILWAIGYPKKD